MRRGTFTLLLSALVLTGCADAFTAPTEVAPDPALHRGRGDWTLPPRERVVVSLDNTIFVDCLDEDVRFVGDAVYLIRRITTPSGVEILSVIAPAAAVETPFLAIGQSSGTVWTLERGLSLQTIVWREGVTNVVHVTRRELYVAEDGSSLRLRHTLRLRLVDGELVGVDREEWSCR